MRAAIILGFVVFGAAVVVGRSHPSPQTPDVRHSVESGPPSVLIEKGSVEWRLRNLENQVQELRIKVGQD